MKIIFMGTPDFAVKSLEALCNAGHEIVGVFTQPDKPQGRRLVLTPSPVKVFAEQKGLKVFQPTTVKTDEAFELLKSLNADLIAVVAYGKILPERILNMTKYGCVNVHASLLPRHRGASPIQWSIYCGDRKTGVSTQQMDIGIDTGDILLTAETDIADSDTFETLHDRLALMGAELLVSTVVGLERGTIIPVKQPEEGACYAPIIKKEMGLVDFKKNANEIDCLIRAFTPWPSAYFFMNGKRVKVISAFVVEKCNAEVGTVINVTNGIAVACESNTSIVFTELQPEGKGKMSAKDFVNGYQIKVGTKL